MKPAVLFCARNLKAAGAGEALSSLRRDNRADCDTYVFECLNRCIECGKASFCKIRMNVIQDPDRERFLRRIRETISK
ncbi:DUF1450 domain-containing protein [Paenibacillus humicola]|uniref:DUF1450 domain-containing protein n=1 Tax=Paenibacillus humicola TaxID=3110540 RepID=UPI00237AF423|nr:DUF1450 domain-containing protein [Paenibacillus humicola]